MKLFKLSTIWFLTATLLLTTAPLPAADSAARADFDKSYAQYKDITKQLFDLRDRYPVATEAERPAMEEKYNELLKQGNELRPKVLSLAEKAYVEDPKDETLGNLLLTVVDNALRSDGYEEGYRLAKLLIEHKHPSPLLANYAGASAFFLNKYDEAEKYLKEAKASNTLNEEGARALDSIPEYREKWARELKFRESDAKSDLPRVKLTIGDAKGNVKGDIVVELFENEAPNTVANFLSLVSKKFYDGLVFHRVIGGFMAQGGDPEGTGTGGPGYTIADECNQPNHRDHFRGSLSMAHSAAPDSNGSQFFMNFVSTSHLDGKHTVFGRIVEGMDVLPKIQRTEMKDDKGQPVPVRGVLPDKIVKAVELPSKREHSHSPKTLPDKK